jgi:hypothetical protein
MPKLVNPTNRQKRAMLDRISSAYVRSHSKCESGQGCNGSLTNSHIIGRTYIKVQFDPRNIQCICAHEHGIFTNNPIIHSRFAEQSDCGKYIDTMLIQANAISKPDYDLWLKIYQIIKDRKYSLNQSREWLDQTILLSELDITSLA